MMRTHFWTRWLPLLALILVVAWGAYLRLAYLENDPVLQDELTQYFVAESLMRGEGPLLPSGEAYTRGIDVTRMVGWSVEQLGPTLQAIRLPSALLGVVNLVLFGVLLWWLGGGWVAFWGTLLLAIDPELVEQSRDLRFYTYQLSWGLIALFAGWRALRRAGHRTPPDREQLLRQWGWVLLTAFALLMALRVQLTTFSVVAGWGTCVALAALADVAALRGLALRKSIPLQLSVVGLLGVVALLTFWGDLLAELFARSQAVPYWARLAGNSPLAYYYYLSDLYPLLLSLAPLIFLVLGLRRPRLAVYLGVWFAVPIVLHSFVFPWKGQRFVLLAMPALFTAGAFAATYAAAAVGRLIRGALARQGVGRRYLSALTAGAVGAVAFFAIVTTPAFNRTRDVPQTTPTPGWAETVALIRSTPGFDSLPFGHSTNLEAMYYVGDLDFAVSKSFLEVQGTWNPVGSADYYSGAPVLTTPEAIRERFSSNGSVLVGIDLRYEDRDLDPQLLAVLRSEAEELCRGACGTMRLYHWEFDTRTAADTIAPSATHPARRPTESASRRVGDEREASG